MLASLDMTLFDFRKPWHPAHMYGTIPTNTMVFFLLPLSLLHILVSKSNTSLFMEHLTWLQQEHREHWTLLDLPSWITFLQAKQLEDCASSLGGEVLCWLVEAASASLSSLLPDITSIE